MAQINLKTEYDRELDIFTAYVADEVQHPLETIPGPYDGHILFEIDSVNGKLVKIIIYDFSVIRRVLMKEWIFLLTKKAIQNWLQMIVNIFQESADFYKRRYGTATH